ncbi:hypothetical protein PU645_23545, partial [Klebsiella pneumoniae]
LGCQKACVLPENPASYRVVRTKSYLFNKAATRHRVLCTRRSGEEVDMEVYMFAEIDDSGRFIRIEEATLMLKGRESDRDLGSVR